ncbi:hypothetical protein Btru_075465 [Bulinus truncatus]|nr:hypothetical protein Btru_075465 [Bulinus truncatus]
MGINGVILVLSLTTFVQAQGTATMTASTGTATLTTNYCAATLTTSIVNINNVNDSSVFSVKEDEPVGYVIVDLDISNPQNVSYFLDLNTGGGPFILSGTKLQLSDKLDYETKTSYQITIIIKSYPSGSWLGGTNFKIAVLDVVNEDNLPNITVYSGDVSLREDSRIGTIVPFNYTVQNLAGRVATYILSTPSPIFSIDPQNGEIRLNSTIDADQLTLSLVYKTVLLVNTSDARSSSVTFTLTILDINDNPPVCDHVVQYSHVTENVTAPLNVDNLNCSDNDRDPINRNLSYSIIQDNASLFSVNSSGSITTIDVIDYEQIQKAILWIKVRDGGSNVELSTTVTVIVYVTPINDNRPSFSTWQPAIPTDRTYTLPENSSAGTILFTVRATDDDRDVGGDVTYSISATNASASIQNVFIIDPYYGTVSLFGKVDADAGITLYSITAQASDGTYNVTQDVLIQITDVNDNVPKFVGLPHNVTWPEQSCVANFVIVNLTANDADVSTANLTMEVKEIAFGSGNLNDWEVLSSSPTTAQLRLKRAIDLDKGDTNTFLLKLTVRDGGSPELTGTASLILYILPDNEFQPEIISSPDNLTIPENFTIGTVVGTLISRDNDTGAEGQLVYNITDGNNGNAFKIDSDGKLMIVGKLDTEVLNKYNLTIKVRDSGIDQKTTTSVIHITVSDVNEFMPDCPLLNFVSLPENSSINTSVFLFNCTDRDGDLLTYTVQQPENETFSYSSTKQGLILIKLVDYDSPVQQYLVKIDVSDGIFTTVVNIRIQLTHVNEDQPKFLSNVTLNITENTQPTNPVLKYTANDTDYSPDNIVKYVLITDLNISSLFSIDPIAGEISLLKDLDYDSLPVNHKFYILQVVAEDGGGLQGTGTVTVNVLNVNDNAPKCSHVIFTANVNETQNGNGPFVLIPSLGCTDVEDGTSLNYTLSQSPGSHFTIQNQAIQLINNTLDYETATSHTLSVTVSDNGTPSLNITVVIYITVLNMNDGPPVFPAIAPVHILETANIGAVVVVVNATDPDGSDPVFGDPQYTIISGDPTNRFTIGLVSGELALKRMLDYEMEKAYTLVIQAKERGDFYSSTTNVTILVDDVNDELPFCDPNFIFSSVAENETANYLIATLNCSDKDAGTNLTYTVDDVNSTKLFQMTGVNLSLKSALDFETATSHVFRINVSDGNHTVQIDVFINVRSIDEYPPVFLNDHYLVNVSEDVNISTVVLTVHANDSDSPLDGNGIVKYMLSASPEFIIDPETGEILVTKYLDREKTPHYKLTVFAHDASYVANATVEVSVTDVNDNPPVFTSSTYSQKISETSPANTSLITVTATDKDDPLTNGNGIVQYAIGL